MFPTRYLLNEIRHRWQILTHGGKDAGYTTETVIAIALLAALAIAVLAIVAAKITAKANSIDLGIGAP